MTGTVKNIVRDRGFAFAMGEDAALYFVHCTDVVTGSFADIIVGDSLSFEPKVTAKGLRAMQVVVG